MFKNKTKQNKKLPLIISITMKMLSKLTPSPHYQPISNSKPFLPAAGECAASQSDFEDKWGWFIQLLCPDDKMGAT